MVKYSLPRLTDLECYQGMKFSYLLPSLEGAKSPAVVGYSVKSVLPAGLDFNPKNRIISGVPTEKGRYEVIYTATDENLEVYTSKFIIVIDTFKHTFADLKDIITVNNKFFSAELPEATGSELVKLSYKLIGNLPEGLEFSESSRMLTGTPTLPGEYKVSYSVYNDFYSHSLNFTILVNDKPYFKSEQKTINAPAGSYLDVTLPKAHDIQGSAMAYSLVGLPEGLSFDDKLCRVHGDLTDSFEVDVIYTARNTEDLAEAMKFTISSKYLAPSFESVRSNYNIHKNDIVSIKLPEGKDPAGLDLYYILDGNLPKGLQFDSTSRTIKGQVESTGSYNVSYEVVNKIGLFTEKQITIDVVEADSSIGYAVSVGESLSIDAAEGCTSKDLANYSIEGELPAGVALDYYSGKVYGETNTPGKYVFTCSSLVKLNVSKLNTFRVQVMSDDNSAIVSYSETTRLDMAHALQIDPNAALREAFNKPAKHGFIKPNPLKRF